MNFFKKYQFSIVVIFIFLITGCEEKNNRSIQVEYYGNGKIKSIKSYRNKMLNGECAWFYPNGFLERKVIYVDGEEDGNAYYFYESGALKSHRFWKERKMFGVGADY